MSRDSASSVTPVVTPTRLLAAPARGGIVLMRSVAAPVRPSAQRHALDNGFVGQWLARVSILANSVAAARFSTMAAPVAGSGRVLVWPNPALKRTGRYASSCLSSSARPAA
jgi:hypothetical protein